MSEMQDRLSQVRFYTDQDPYFYTVDNRPLGDLDANDKALATGIDAAKYIALGSSLGLSYLAAGTYGANNLFVTQSLSYSGLSLTLGAGFVLTPEAISPTNSKVVVKQGLLIDPVTLTFSTPASAGNAVDYLVQVRYHAVDTSTQTLPLIDNTNPYLAGDLLVGYCEVQVLTGNEAASGTQLVPSPTTGWQGALKVTVLSDAASIDATDVEIYPGVYVGPIDVNQLRQDLTDHLNSTSAHNAGSIVYAGSTNTPSGSVEQALDSLDANKAGLSLANTFTQPQTIPAGTAANHAATKGQVDTVQGNLDTHVGAADPHPQYATDDDLLAHLTDTTDAHDASAISSAPSGFLGSNNVQTSLYELDSEKVHRIGTIADLRAMPIPESQISASVLGYYTPGDGGGGQFYWDSASTASDNGGTVILPTGYTGTGRWIRNYSGAVNVKWFGAKGDGVTDDTTKIQATFDAVVNGGVAFVPHGTYTITSPLVVSNDVRSIEIYGESPSWNIGQSRGSILRASGTPVAVLDVFGMHQGTIRNLTVDVNGTGADGMKIHSVNPRRSVSNAFSNLAFLDSQNLKNAVGIRLADSTANQVSETHFDRIYFHTSLKNCVIHAGDNTVDISWSRCLFNSDDTCYRIKGGGEVAFENRCEFASTLNVPMVTAEQDAGGNNTAISVVPSHILFVGAYTEPNTALYWVSVIGDGVGLPADDAVSTEYPGRISIDFIGCGVWCSTARNLVNLNPSIKTDVTVHGGRFHNITSFSAGATSTTLTNGVHNTTLFSPIVTGPSANTIFDQSYGQPFSFARGSLKARMMMLANRTSSSAYSRIANVDGGGLEFISGVNGLWKMESNGNLASFGDGSWNTPHIVLGNNHIWVEAATGKLRMKVGAPTSDADGVVIGTQT